MILVLLLLLLLLQLLQQRQVIAGIGLVRCPRQGFLVGVDGLVQFTGPGQGVAAVVPAVGIVTLGELVGGGSKILALVGRGAGPVRAFEQVHCLLAVALLQGPLALLVRGQPQVVPAGGPDRLRLGHQQQRQQAQHPAPAEQRQRQRQQQQHQQVALVLPGVGGAIQRHGLFAPRQRRFRQQRVQVAVVDLHGHVAAAGVGGQLAQQRLVQRGHHDGAVAVLEEAAAGQRYRRTGGGAHAQHRQARTAVGQGPLDSGAVLVPDAVGHQQYPAVADAGRMQQVDGLCHRRRGVTAGQRHHAGVQRRQQVGDGGGVVGQGRDDVGVTGVGDQPGLPLLARGQQVLQFLPRPVQPRGGQVARFHRVAQVQHQHQGVLLLVYRLRQLLPAGAAGGERRQ